MTYQTGQRFKCLYKGEQSKGEITSIAGDFVELKINNKSTITVHKDALNIKCPHTHDLTQFEIIPDTSEEPNNMENKILELIKKVSEKHNLRKYLNVNNFGYSQVERDLASAIIKLFSPDTSEPVKGDLVFVGNDGKSWSHYKERYTGGVAENGMYITEDEGRLTRWPHIRKAPTKEHIEKKKAVNEALNWLLETKKPFSDQELITLSEYILKLKTEGK